MTIIQLVRDARKVYALHLDAVCVLPPANNATKVEDLVQESDGVFEKQTQPIYYATYYLLSVWCRRESGCGAHR